MITDLKEFFAECSKNKKLVSLIYYCKAGAGTFYVNMIDADGKTVPKRHPATGTLIYNNNLQVFEQVLENWEPMVMSRSAKADALSFKKVESDEKGNFTLYQKELIKVLEGMANNPSVKVSREDDYKKEQNPSAFEREQELNKLKSEIANIETNAIEKGKLQGKKESLSEIDKLNKQLAEAETAISDLTKPKEQSVKNK